MSILISIYISISVSFCCKSILLSDMSVLSSAAVSLYTTLTRNRNHRYDKKGMSSYETNPASFMILLMPGIALAGLILSFLIIIQPSIIKDPNLKVESVVNGLSSPTSMAFIDINNIYNIYTTYNIYKSTLDEAEFFWII